MLRAFHPNMTRQINGLKSLPLIDMNADMEPNRREDNPNAAAFDEYVCVKYVRLAFRIKPAGLGGSLGCCVTSHKCSFVTAWLHLRRNQHVYEAGRLRANTF